MDIITSTLAAVMAIALMLWLDPALFTLVLVIIAASTALIEVMLAGIRTASEQTQASVGAMSAEHDRALGAIRTVRAGRAEEREQTRIGEAVRACATARVRAGRAPGR
ncbi:ABC transporter transmembrane domain-containing protein [Nonomuraea sp. MTCD27]|uniref:ABC transporter transmembrane domain-containing protein n=1 Tax=Nonomuraea sp. MTCD27 TaxID=1676747 RepID=UPI0035C02CA6